MCQSYLVPTLTVLVKKYTPCQGVVWSQYRLLGTFYVALGFGVVLFAKVCFFLLAQFCKPVDFTLALLHTNFKLRYIYHELDNGFQYFLQILIARPEFWGPNFYSLFFKYKQCFYENIINNDTNHTNYNVTMCQSYSS